MDTRIQWIEAGQERSALWRSESGMPAPKKVVIADDQTPADTAYRLACEGTALLWRGDFQNARQLLQALARRADHKGGKGKRAKAPKVPATPAEAFHLHRQAQSQRARTLAMLLIPFDADYTIPLRRAPDVKLACNEAYGRGEQPFVASLRELLGVIGGHEWRKNGVDIPALGERIHPHYGVFSPIR
ncbi:methyltransferase, partial [Massilia cavernae]